MIQRGISFPQRIWRRESAVSEEAEAAWLTAKQREGGGGRRRSEEPLQPHLWGCDSGPLKTNSSLAREPGVPTVSCPPSFLKQPVESLTFHICKTELIPFGVLSLILATASRHMKHFEQHRRQDSCLTRGLIRVTRSQQVEHQSQMAVSP